jgi:hypothetical protein
VVAHQRLRVGKVNDGRTFGLDQEWVRSYKRQQILVARDNDNINDALTIAGNDKVLQSFLAERWRRHPGEQKRRPRDHSPAKAGELDELLAEIALLRQLWKAHNIKVKAPIEAARNIIIKRARGGERLLTALAARYENRARAQGPPFALGRLFQVCLLEPC